MAVHNTVKMLLVICHYYRNNKPVINFKCEVKRTYYSLPERNTTIFEDMFMCNLYKVGRNMTQYYFKNHKLVSYSITQEGKPPYVVCVLIFI